MAQQAKPAPFSERWQNQGIDEAMPSKPGFSTQVVDFPRIVGGKKEKPPRKRWEDEGRLTTNEHEWEPAGEIDGSEL
jgi:hypothetical protein